MDPATLAMALSFGIAELVAAIVAWRIERRRS